MKLYSIKIKKIKIYTLNIVIFIFFLISTLLPWGYLSPFRSNISISLYEIVKDVLSNTNVLFDTLKTPPIQGTVCIISFLSFFFIIIGGILSFFFRGGVILVLSGMIIGFIALILTPFPLNGSKVFDVGFYIGFLSLIISVFSNFILSPKEEKTLPLPLIEEATPPLSLSLLIGPACPKCNRATIYVSEYQKYYCQYCKEYIS